MDISKIGVLGLLQQKMQFTSERQQAISENIANVDTPKYTRKDVKEPSFAGMVNDHMKVELTTTNGKHISGTNANSGLLNTYDTGEKVAVDQEAIAMMENRLDFNSATATYKKILTILKDVANSNR